MMRCVEPEWLDGLPTTDRRAIQSRRDLRRLNAIMGHARFVANALRASADWCRKIVDLGAGDGRFLLRVGKQLGADRGRVEAVLIDRLSLVEKPTAREFEALGWNVTTRVGDVFEVLAELPKQTGVAIMSNLFLHHFSDLQLRRLLELQAQRAGIVIACEPRRSVLPLTASRLVGFLGCNAVTRHDAVASVRAGFTNTDLTSLWSDAAKWSIQEGPIGLFSHGFFCRKKTQ